MRNTLNVYNENERNNMDNKMNFELDVDPQRDDDASPMSYGCMLRPTWMFMENMTAGTFSPGTTE